MPSAAIFRERAPLVLAAAVALVALLAIVAAFPELATYLAKFMK